MAFQGVDYYNIDELLTDDEKMIRQTVRSFVDDEVMPVIEKHYREGTFPMDLARKMGELGVFGITLPEEYGCAGASNVSYGLAMQELERGDSAVRSFASVQSSLVMYPIFTYATEENKRKWPPKLATAEAVGCF